MMRHLIGAAAVAMALSAVPVLAQQEPANGPVVVELFTSQGCSSCPPADALLAELAARDDVLALSLHVDYWDYIGWADVFADPAFTRRQKGYAAAAGRQMIYTPQMIVGGRTDVVGHKAMKVVDAIAAQKARPARVGLTLDGAGQGGRITVLVEPLAGPVPRARVHLVRFTPAEEVEISRGENAGRRLSYVNVVRQMELLGDWAGAESARFEISLDGAGPAALIVQVAPYGEVLAAARLR